MQRMPVSRAPQTGRYSRVHISGRGSSQATKSAGGEGSAAGASTAGGAAAQDVASSATPSPAKRSDLVRTFMMPQ